MGPDAVDRLNAALGGRYRIREELGTGGMATVYLAEDVRHGRTVALKVLRPELAAALGADRFLREISVAARLNHPHVVPLYDSGEAAGMLFYVMPYIKGESLRHRLAREKQLPVDDALAIARQAAGAIEHAHSQGLVHRDVKPENILLHEGEAMVADFGIALPMHDAPGDRITATGLMIGTAEYMSPEQAAGERDLDARTDIYSLGCVLYEMLAGEPPFTGRTAQAVAVRRLTEPVRPLRSMRPSVPAAVERAVMKALARIPADRFATAAEFAAALGATSAAPPARASVAVLPFLNLSADPENEFFTEGITEDVIAQLAKIRSLKVISRTSVMPFKGRDRNLRAIGAMLEVGTLLEGSVRRAGERVRIVAQLIDAATERHLWAETYDRQLTDIFEIQSDVALHIASALKAELSSDEHARIRLEPTSDLRAYQFYLQARFCRARYSEEGVTKALDYFEKAIAVDEHYALAYAGMALVYAETATTEGIARLTPAESIERARSAVQKALALDPDLGEAHGVVGLLKFTYEFDWAGAERAFKLALELSPGNADIHDHYGWMCAALERYDEALVLLARAQELDPLAHKGSDVANTLLRAGRYDEAVQAAQRAIDFDPNHSRGHSVLGWAYINLGRGAEGIAELEKAVALSPADTLFIGQLGEAYAMAGLQEEARAMLRKIDELARTRYVSPYHRAYVYTGLGEHETALDLLEDAYEQRAGGVYGIKGSHLFHPLRPHPRFKALLRRMNLA